MSASNAASEAAAAAEAVTVAPRAVTVAPRARERHRFHISMAKYRQRHPEATSVKEYDQAAGNREETRLMMEKWRAAGESWAAVSATNLPLRDAQLSRQEFEELTRNISSHTADSTTTFRLFPVDDVEARAALAPPMPPGAMTLAAPARQRSRSRAPRAQTHGWCATPEPEAKYVLVDTSLLKLLRQMTNAQVRNLLTAALHRHGNGFTGQFAQTNLRIDEGSTTIFWRLEAAAGSPRRRVSTLEALDTGTDGVGRP